MKFNTGDKVRVVNDWIDIEAKKKRCQILSFQENFGETYAKLLWLGTDGAYLAEKYGTLFPLDELRLLP